MKSKFIVFLSLFGSLGTLLCCALPVTLVSLGMGATFASLLTVFPQITWVTERKGLLFIITGVLLCVSYYFIRKSQKAPCPIDPEQRKLCESSKKVSRYILWTSISFYLIGLLFSYLLPVIIYG